MFQTILDLLARIKTALDAISQGSTGGLTSAQTQQVGVMLTGLAQQAESIAGAVPPPPPVISISTISPNPAAVGGAITIGGSGFGTTQGSGGVDINGIQASITMWADSTIVAVVPSGASTGTLAVTNNAQQKASAPFSVQ